MSQRTVRIGATLLCLSWLQGTAWCGSNSNSAKFYGLGVHQFFQGRYFDAIKNFDIATSYDSEDARIYFFRGIAKRRLGWTANAADDLQMGAQVEAFTRRSNVGRALQRIQGPERLSVERYRREARKLDRELLMSLMQDPAAPQVAKSPKPAAPRESSAEHARVQFEALPDDATDPFANEPDGFLLGRGKIERADDGFTETDDFAGEDDAFGDDEPFGTGVADDAGDNVFGDDDFADADDMDAAPDAEAGGEKRGVIGAAIRAFGRSLTPSVPDVPVAVPGIGPGQAPPAEAADGFGGDDDFRAAPEADPFGDGFGDDPAPAEADDEDLGDPFQDDDF